MKVQSLFILSIFGFLVVGCGGGGSKDTGSTNPSKKEEKATATSVVDPATAGKIQGTVKFTGTKPKAKAVSMKADAFCSTAHSSKIYAEDVVVNPNGTLKNVYVYVKSGLGDLKFPVPSDPVIFDQVGCVYKPHVVVVQTGQVLRVRNSDGVLHNVNARPKTNRGFNFGQPVKGMETKKSFKKSELGIPVKCDVHPWMRGFIHVQSHPYGLVTGDDGSFNLPNLPPGTYEIEAWHEVYGSSVKKVTVGAKETKVVQFSFKGS